MSTNSTDTDAAAAQAAAVAAAIKEAAYFIKLSQIFFCSVYAVVVWDWLTSLQREYRLIWKTKWSIIKALYIACRYYVILVMPYVLWVYVSDHSLEVCHKVFRSPVALAMWNQLFAEAVLLIRTYAFLGNRWQVLVFLIVCLAAVVTYQLYVDTSQLALLPFLDPSAGGPCFPTTTYAHSPHVMAFFLVSLIFDLIVTALTLWRALQLRTLSGGARSPLLKTFVTEGIYYFFMISAANLINAVFYWQPKAVMSALLVPFSVMLPDVLACRMILGLRERGVRHTSNHGTSNHQASYQHTARKLSVGNKLTSFSPGAGGDRGTNGGTITNMGFDTATQQHHELTTFHNDVSDGDIKSVPLEIIDEDVHHTTTTVQRSTSGHAAGRQRTLTDNAIRVDIESHRYYEDDDRSSEKKGGRSFMP